MELLSELQQFDKKSITQSFEKMGLFGDKLMKFLKKYKSILVDLRDKFSVYEEVSEIELNDEGKRKYSILKDKITEFQVLVYLLEYASNVTSELQQLKNMIDMFGDGKKYHVYNFILNKN